MIWLGLRLLVRRVAEMAISRGANVLIAAVLVLVGFGSDVGVGFDTAHAAGSSIEAAKYNYDPEVEPALTRSLVSPDFLESRAAGSRGDVAGPEAAERIYDSSTEQVAPSGLLDGFVDVGSGASLIRRVDVDGVPVSIKSGHGYRPDHGSVDITGVLGRDAVDSAVATDLATRVSAGTSVSRAGSGHSTFQTVVGGHTVEYRAVFVPATGRYEVGTYYIP